MYECMSTYVYVVCENTWRVQEALICIVHTE